MLMALSGKAALKLHYYLVIVESLENLYKALLLKLLLGRRFSKSIAN